MKHIPPTIKQYMQHFQDTLTLERSVHDRINDTKIIDDISTLTNILDRRQPLEKRKKLLLSLK